ncbi:hypothetical protein [Microcoleus sp. BROC3]
MTSKEHTISGRGGKASLMAKQLDRLICQQTDSELALKSQMQ